MPRHTMFPPVSISKKVAAITKIVDSRTFASTHQHQIAKLLEFQAIVRRGQNVLSFMLLSVHTTPIQVPAIMVIDVD